MNCNNLVKKNYQSPSLTVIPFLVKAYTQATMSGADFDIEDIRDGGSWDRP